nr:RodZ domain-containing protein [Thiocapsa imhoffii]
MARQARGLSIERVASQLHLKPGVVDAIEQDRFAELPDPVFVLGYLRNYARILGIDAAPLLATYRSHALAHPHQTVPAAVRGPGEPSGGARLMIRLMTVILAAAAIGIFVLWWSEQTDVARELGAEITLEPTSEIETMTDAEPDPRPDLTRMAMPAPLTTPTQPDTAGEEASRAPRVLQDADGALSDVARRPEDLDEPGILAAVPLAPDVAGASVGTTAPADDPIVTPAEPAIVLEFTGPSWLTVTPPGGGSLINAEMTAGERREITGPGPFRFTIGRVNNTRMTVNGEPFDLEGRARGNVARFTFDPAASP